MVEHFMIFKIMKNFGLCIFAILVTSLSALGQEDYRRSSLYSILVRHPEKYYDREIDTAFASIPIPHKFNDHSLKIKAINCVSNRSDQSDIENVKSTIDAFITKNQLGKRLVAKWFNRKQGRNGDGTFDMNLVIERGLYDADYFDLLIANQSIRGHSVLADAGEDLIGNTFVLFNDIRYLDKEEAAFWASMGVVLVGAIASELTGGLASLAISAATNASVRINNEIAGFRVSITSYLYQLSWNEEVANSFYSDYYTQIPDEEKKILFDRNRDLFKLEYVGSHSIVTSQTTLGGVQTPSDMIRKVCERAIDENIAKLQKEYEVFRVKTPLFSIEPLTAKIGLKEDITPDSRFEVLEIVEKDGRTEYKRVGVIKPIKGRIWDNRFMAEFEDENKGTDLTATEFEVVNGSGFYPGMLIREI